MELIEKRKRQNAYNVAWRLRNPLKAKEQMKASMLRQRYGITTQDYENMLKFQNGKCAICRKEVSQSRRLCADHNHATGKVRGLLCPVCNSVLGFIESPRYKMALDYLNN
jgi:hypothetical protein